MCVEFSFFFSRRDRARELVAERTYRHPILNPFIVYVAHHCTVQSYVTEHQLYYNQGVLSWNNGWYDKRFRLKVLSAVILIVLGQYDRSSGLQMVKGSA